MSTSKRSNFQAHCFHLVSGSPWPIYTSFALLNVTTSAALSMHNFNNSYYIFYISLILVISSMSFWFRDIMAQGRSLDHTLALKKKLDVYGMTSLFVVITTVLSILGCIEIGCNNIPVNIDLFTWSEWPIIIIVSLTVLNIAVSYIILIVMFRILFGLVNLDVILSFIDYYSPKAIVLLFNNYSKVGKIYTLPKLAISPLRKIAVSPFLYPHLKLDEEAFHRNSLSLEGQIQNIKYELDAYTDQLIKFKGHIDHILSGTEGFYPDASISLWKEYVDVIGNRLLPDLDVRLKNLESLRSSNHPLSELETSDSLAAFEQSSDPLGDSYHPLGDSDPLVDSNLLEDYDIWGKDISPEDIFSESLEGLQLFTEVPPLPLEVVTPEDIFSESLLGLDLFVESV